VEVVLVEAQTSSDEPVRVIERCPSHSCSLGHGRHYTRVGNCIDHHSILEVAGKVVVVVVVVVGMTEWVAGIPGSRYKGEVPSMKCQQMGEHHDDGGDGRLDI
jgi:hypothetical protein